MQKTSKKMLLFGNLKLGRGGGIFPLKAPKKSLDPAGELNCVYEYILSSAPMAELQWLSW